MKLALADIPTRGIEFALGSQLPGGSSAGASGGAPVGGGAPWARDALARGLADGVGPGGSALRAFAGHLVLTRHGAHVALRGELHAVAEIGCARCGTPIVVSLGGDVSTVYSPISTLPVTREPLNDADGDLPRAPIDLPFQVLDLGEFDGQTFDVADALREWAAVEAPTRALCGDLDPAEDAACLARFREAAGAASAPAVDPRFAVLHTFKPTLED